MPTPKARTKIDSKGIKLISYEDEVKYEIFELTRAAFRDVSKFVMRTWKDSYYKTFKKRTGKGGKAIKSKVWSSQNTKYPRVEIGLPHSHKGKPVEGFYSFFQEFGTSKTPRYGLLRHAVEDNIPTIRTIEAQYLEYIEDPSKTSQRLLKVIDENEEEITLEY